MQGDTPVVATLVQAGAGTGKTQNLSEEILRVATVLHSQLERMPRIVATTFTERATAELRERVISVLPRFMESEENEWLEEFTREPGYLHISTIHGTLSLLLHRYGSLLGIDPGFRILESNQETELIRRVLRRLLSSDEKVAGLLEDYSFDQLALLVKKLSSHARAFGKSFQAASGWREILNASVERCRNAFRELESAPVDDLPEKLGAMIRTLQALGRRLSTEKQVADYQARFLEGIEGLRKPSIKEGGRGSELASLLTEIFALRDDWREDWFRADINELHDKMAGLLTELVGKFNAEYMRAKQEEGVLSFEDLEFLSLELLEKFPHVRKHASSDWDYWFVDEYQDTSPLQKRILEFFFKPEWNVYFVGDPQQSIYLFRGADKTVFEKTLSEVFRKNGRILNLQKNWRTQPSLLHFMNYLFKSVREHPFVELEPRGESDGRRRAVIHKLSDKKIDETRIAVRQIHHWFEQGYLPHQISILVRTNDKARLYARALSEAGIPTFLHEAGGFYSRREVLDALAILSFLDDPSRDDHFVLIARSPWGGIPDAVLAKWGAARGKELSFWQWLEKNPHERDLWPSLKILGDLFRRYNFTPASVIFESALRRLGLFEFCALGDTSGRREANLCKIVHQVAQAEIEPGFNLSSFLRRAWSSIDEGGDEGEAASFVEPKRVNILTIHKSKGLKFDCVLVPDCGRNPDVKHQNIELGVDGSWAIQVLSPEAETYVSPLVLRALKEKRKEREWDEQLRVFYVAVTRAAEELCLLTQDPPGENSWLGKSSILLDDGDRKVKLANYRVRRWSLEGADRLKLPALPDHLAEPGVSDQPFRYREPPKDRQVPRISVSLLLGNKSQSLPRHFQAPLAQELETSQRGQALHFLFETWGRNKMGVEEAIRVARGRFAAHLEISAEKISQTLALKEPPLSELLRSGWREFPFLLEVDGLQGEKMPFAGRIDLWGDADDVVWVVDYKSFGMGKNKDQSQLNSAFLQLEAYALALEKLGKKWGKMKLAVISPLQAQASVRAPRSRQEVLSEVLALIQESPSPLKHPDETSG